MKILCIGDSLTQGDYGVAGKTGIAALSERNYPYFLAGLTGATVINCGKCGYTATSYLEYYKSGAVKTDGADIIIVMLGTNGSLEPDDPDARGNADYDALINTLKTDFPGAEIVLCTPPHVTKNPEMSGCGCEEKVEKAVSFVREYAAKKNIPIIDTALCPDFTQANEHIMQANDGVHFVEAGYKVLAGYIRKGLAELFPQMTELK